MAKNNENSAEFDGYGKVEYGYEMTSLADH